ncbi:amidohydrolase family protein [Demequina sp. SYSU T00068]|uniref:N-acetylglucosamine-6-phosphate deacetylase n=1 Tax=Demequina lignilytica TaxID=3051663 RepID=UPI0026258CA0|nr:amidohydrolase family protein [Demequina sp. SYSU T00068]MDN4490113.1 amidohydrolase family protein [Demequina sp. SYSU T00068]
MDGLVDIHCHGGGGHDFGDTVDGTLAAVDAHRAHGTARIVASLVSMPIEGVARAAAVIREAMRLDDALVGIHLEGPFLAPARKGAHDPSALAAPAPAAVAALLDACDGTLRQITVAPELPGAVEAIRTLVDAGVVVAVGHTECTADQARAAFDAGASLITHGFNAMRPIAGREPGPLGAAIEDPRVSIEVIADGIHVAPTNIATLFRAAPGRVVLVTDAMSAAAAAPGRYLLGGLDVDVTSDGRAVLAGTDTLAGSTLTLDRAVEVCVAAGVAREDAVAAASSVPARVIGL